MKTAPLEIKTAIQVKKTAEEVFEAIVDPAKMSNYFIAKGSGRMETDKEITWKFPEFDADVPVRCGKITPHHYISFHWDGPEETKLLVEMNLRQQGDSTVITVIEKEMVMDEKGIAWLKGNTEGWANFLACLKAYLEFGINLRKGAFDFMKAD